MELHDTEISKVQGVLVIKKHDARTGEFISESAPIKNLVVNNSTRGYDLIARRLIGDETYGIEIDSAAVGTGSTAVSAADTALQTPVLTGIQVANVEHLSTGKVRISFFVSDGALANATYNEFAVYIGAQLFSRLIISPALIKGSNQNITFEYTITLG